MTDALWRLAHRVAARLYDARNFVIRPRVTGAVVLVRVGAELLLVRSSYRPWLTVPGGRVGLREAPLEAAVRELHEEVGVRVVAAALRPLGEFVVHHSNLEDHIHAFELRLEAAPPLRIDHREITWAGFHPEATLQPDTLWPPPPEDPEDGTRVRRGAMGAGEVLLLRHAESVWNADGRWQGHGDPPLSEAGWAQARASVASLPVPPTAIVSSDLRRARDTARVIAEAFGLAIDMDPRWREWDIGAWSGHTRDEIAARWPEGYARFRAGDRELVPPGGESRLALEARVREALADARARHAGERILVVCHRGPIRVLLPDLRPSHAAPVPLPEAR